MSESFEDAMKAMYGEEPRTRPPLPDGFLKTDAEMEKVCGKQFVCGTSRNPSGAIEQSRSQRVISDGPAQVTIDRSHEFAACD
jgi:hypothetical protein